MHFGGWQCFSSTCTFLFDLTDLFDEEGFSLADINETLIGEEAIQQQNDVYFLDSDDDTGAKNKKQPEDEVGEGDKAELSLEEEVDLQRARVKLLAFCARPSFSNVAHRKARGHRVRSHMMYSISVSKMVIEHWRANYSILK